MKKRQYLTKIGKDIYNVLTRGGYVKGYTDSLVRVCDKNHNPLFNANRTDFEFLKRRGVVLADGLRYILNESINPKYLGGVYED